MPQCQNCNKIFKRTGKSKGGRSTEKLCEECWMIRIRTRNRIHERRKEKII